MVSFLRYCILLGHTHGLNWPTHFLIFYSGSDAIIRQHKAACLRITALLICKDLLWVGTSAGVVLTIPIPKVTSSTSAIPDTPSVNGSGQGHTGHVRFLTFVDVPTVATGKPGDVVRQRKHSEQAAPPPIKGLNLEQRRQSVPAALQSAMMVISGGDGYEDFSASTPNEAAGKEDSTNHLLLWQVWC